MDATSGPTATDAGVVEIAPVIQSFEIVSDRISNLEESIGILLAHARHREVRTFPSRATKTRRLNSFAEIPRGDWRIGPRRKCVL